MRFFDILRPVRRRRFSISASIRVNTASQKFASLPRQAELPDSQFFHRADPIPLSRIVWFNCLNLFRADPCDILFRGLPSGVSVPLLLHEFLRVFFAFISPTSLIMGIRIQRFQGKYSLLSSIFATRPAVMNNHFKCIGIVGIRVIPPHSRHMKCLPLAMRDQGYECHCDKQIAHELQLKCTNRHAGGIWST